MDQRGLSSHSKKVLLEKDQSLFVSAVSALEIGIKLQKKQLVLPLDVSIWFSRMQDLHGIK